MKSSWLCCKLEWWKLQWRRDGRTILAIVGLGCIILVGISLTTISSSICGLQGQLHYPFELNEVSREELFLSKIPSRTPYYDQVDVGASPTANTASHLRLHHPMCMDDWLATAAPRNSQQSAEEFRTSITKYVQSKYKQLGFDIIEPVKAVSAMQSTNNAPQTIRWMSCDHRKLSEVALSFYIDHSTDLPLDMTHFSKYYLRFVSLLMWQSRVYHTVDESCIHVLAIEQSDTFFWNQLQQPHHPLRRFVQYVNYLSKYLTVNTNPCNSVSVDAAYQKTIHSVPLSPKELFVLHPADSFLLTTSILNIDVCAWKGSSLTNINEPLSRVNVTVFTSPGKMSPHDSHRTVHDVHEALERTKSDHGSAFRIRREVIIPIELEFEEIVSHFFHTEVAVIMSDELHIYSSFMKPCSVVVHPVFPELVDERGRAIFAKSNGLSDEDMFQLSSSVDLIDSTLLVTAAHAVFAGKYAEPCHAMINQITNTSSNRIVLTLSRECIHAFKGWKIDHALWQSVLRSGHQARIECLRTHPFLKGSTETVTG